MLYDIPNTLQTPRMKKEKKGHTRTHTRAHAHTHARTHTRAHTHTHTETHTLGGGVIIKKINLRKIPELEEGGGLKKKTNKK